MAAALRRAGESPTCDGAEVAARAGHGAGSAALRAAPPQAAARTGASARPRASRTGILTPAMGGAPPLLVFSSLS